MHRQADLHRAYPCQCSHRSACLLSCLQKARVMIEDATRSNYKQWNARLLTSVLDALERYKRVNPDQKARIQETRDRLYFVQQYGNTRTKQQGVTPSQPGSQWSRLLGSKEVFVPLVCAAAGIKRKLPELEQDLAPEFTLFKKNSSLTLRITCSEIKSADEGMLWLAEDPAMCLLLLVRTLPRHA